MVQSSGGPAGLAPHVIDASVAAKWYLTDEDYADKALALRQGLDAGRLHLLAPEHMKYEASSSLRNAVRARRIAQAAAGASLADLLTSGVEFVAAERLLDAALHLSLRLNTSFYDALYLALAELVDGYVVSHDQRFRRAIGNRHQRVIWLEDYQPGA